MLQLKLLRATPALLTTIFLTSCASYQTPQVARPRLPAAPNEFGKPVELPPVKKGENIKVFALKNRAAVLQANRRLSDDATFYTEVVESYGQ